MTAHFPGPWAVVPGDGGYLNVTTDTRSGGAGMGIYRIHIAERIAQAADARLIAAAPALLEALAATVAHLESLAVDGRTLYAADVNAIEARVREAQRALELALPE